MLAAARCPAEMAWKASGPHHLAGSPQPRYRSSPLSIHCGPAPGAFQLPGEFVAEKRQPRLLADGFYHGIRRVDLRVRRLADNHLMAASGQMVGLGEATRARAHGPRPRRTQNTELSVSGGGTVIIATLL